VTIFNSLTIDVEDWFHVLDSPTAPNIDQWPHLESRIERNVETMLDMLDAYSVKCTFFWLAWAAERHKSLVQRCCDGGHEIASHGYGHVLAYKVGPEAFKNDIIKSRMILEDIIGEAVLGFRTAGFGITDEATWAFEVIKVAGYEYDSSIFPARRGHGGLLVSRLGPHIIRTRTGDLTEVPMSAVEVMGRRVVLFGGGYLRIAPKWLIRLGAEKLDKIGQPLIVYVHPREIDPKHPRLALSLKRRFKCYVNLRSTMPKLQWLCKNYQFVPMRELVDAFLMTKRFVKVDRDEQVCHHRGRKVLSSVMDKDE
jgi:polysaccharide deacetylase family protein (PEP-CTERM system associated)